MAHLVSATCKLAAYGTIPAHAQQLGDAARILAIRLNDHGGERRLDVPGLKQHGLEPGIRQSGMQPLTQRSGLQPDPGDLQPELAAERDQCLGLTRNFGLAHDLASGIDGADAASF